MSIDLIPPRGCAFVCMNRRMDANRALKNLNKFRLHGKQITLAWAPGKGMKDKQWKDYWDLDLGCSYIPTEKVTTQVRKFKLEEIIFQRKFKTIFITTKFHVVIW